VLRGNLEEDPTVIHAVVHVFRDGLGYDPESLTEAARGEVGLR
jgi:hypothetical protein